MTRFFEKLPRVVKRDHLNLPDAYVVPHNEIGITYLPWMDKPLGDVLAVSCFMDETGSIHWEFNHSTFKFRSFLFWTSFLNSKKFYDSLIRDFLETSLLKEEKKLIGGGNFFYHFKKKEAHVINLVVLPRQTIPHVDPEIRKQAFWNLQHAFDQLAAYLGATTARTATLSISDEKMRLMGWELKPIIGFRERWRQFKEWWPLSLRGLQRLYVKQLKFEG